MFYTIYKTTNTVNGKIYIGKHQTEDIHDLYLGSGKHLKRAIDKYGVENFIKEVLFVFDNEADMNAKEAEIVTERFVKEESNYNICPGGQGGWGYINALEDSTKYKIKGGKSHSVEHMKSLHDLSRISRNDRLSRDGEFRHKLAANLGNRFRGLQHSDKSKRIISEKNSIHQRGCENSQFGSYWVTDGNINKKMKKHEDIPEGFYKGRTHTVLNE